ncbi:MAG: UDP-glucose 4-epimerase GalE [Blastocatellia bacterium]|nr:UDP-glucose 4-epimerase GalE [Blastocatellia bacterium]
MNILVTGGAGYIGSVLVEHCADEGHEVFVVDNLVKGYRELVDQRAELFIADIADRDSMVTILNENKIEAVIHMAAYSIVPESNSDPAAYYRNNVIAGLDLLDAMRDAGTDRFVFSSTAAVYGEPDLEAITEDTPTAPTNAYGDTKLTFEKALGWYGRAYGLKWVSLRYFNAAGASDNFGERHDPETHLIPNAIKAAVGELRELSIFGDDYPTKDGTCVRDYIHVRDLARAHLLAVNAAQAEGSVYNLGSGQGLTVREIVDGVTRVSGREVPVKIAPRRSGDPARLVASADKIRSDLGWETRESDLDSIIGSAWKWHQKDRTQMTASEGH